MSRSKQNYKPAGVASAMPLAGYGLAAFLAMSMCAHGEPFPTYDEDSYGPYARNTLDFWQAPGDSPRPLLIYIHGGSWLGFDKDRIIGRVPIEEWLSNGVSVASIDYRLTNQDAILPAPVHDAARAVQFFRYQAGRYNVDPERIALQGSSAGSCSSMWITLHDDLADPNSPDPVLRESSRVAGAYVRAGQTSIDPVVLDEWIGPLAAEFAMIYKAVGEDSYAEMMANYEQHKPLLDEFSPILHVDADDPPLYLWYSTTNTPTTDQQAIHHGNFGINMKALSDEVGHECYLNVNGQIEAEVYPDPADFLMSILNPGYVEANPDYLFHDSFEPRPGMSGALGSLDGQNGWSVVSGSAVVQSNAAFEGSQSLELNSGMVGREVVSTADALWISFRTYLTDADIGVPDVNVLQSSISFYIDSDRHVVVYSNSIPVQLDTQINLQEWSHFVVYSDRADQCWSLSVNGQNAVSGLPLAPADQHPRILKIAHDSNVSGYVDNVILSEQEPLLLVADSDADSIPDWWEKKYFGHPTSADGSSDADGDGYTLAEEYVAGLNPNASDQFVLTPLGDAGSFHWPTAPGRLYDVYWTSNLLNSFGALTVGLPYTSNTFYHADSDQHGEGFYRIEVRPDW